MPGVSKETASQVESADGFEGHYEQIDDYTIGFETYSADFDAEPLFAGLPDDRCQCPHWGYVLSGKIGFRTADGEETYAAGQAYYVPPGHTPILYDGGEVVEFSPTAQVEETMKVVMGNMEKMQAKEGAAA